MGTVGRGLLRLHRNRSPRSVLEKSGPYWRGTMQAKSTKDHPQYLPHLQRKQEGREGREREIVLGAHLLGSKGEPLQC